MSEFGASKAEARAIDQETVLLSDGPVDLYLADHHLRIVHPIRDLTPAQRDGMNHYNIDCFIIDPADCRPRDDVGFKALRPTETVALGEESTHDRFSFSRYVSRDHVSISRDGDAITITDTHSTNGTRLAQDIGRIRTPHLREAEGSLWQENTEQETAAETDTRYSIAAASMASSRHPERNEDAYFTSVDAIGVFDGAGRAKGSERASALAAEVVGAALREAPRNLPAAMAALIIKDAILDAHTRILDEPNGLQIATTATVAKLSETESGTPFVSVGNVGDSRAYLLRSNQIEQLTLDHAFVGGDESDRRDLQETLSQVTDLSLLNHVERAAFDQRNLLTNFLGRRQQNPTVTVSDFELQPGDRLLLTSDGIHDNLVDGEIQATLRDHPRDDQIAVEALIHAAQARSLDYRHPRSKADDMTAAILSFQS